MRGFNMMRESKPRVSVVLPVYNGEKKLPACLDSLMALDFPKEDLEIIVVDNNSTDKTKDIILQYPVLYVFEPNQGRAWARNKGVKNAKADLIAFIDSDCVATKDWLKLLVEGISGDENIAFGGGNIVAFKQETVIERFFEAKWQLSQEIGIKGRYEHDLPRVVTANAICRKNILEQVGYFDEDLITCEDTEISWRIDLSGYEIRFFPEAVVYHQHIRSVWDFCAHYFEYGASDWVVYQKYRSYLRNESGPSAPQGTWQIFIEDVCSQISYSFEVMQKEWRGLPADFLVFAFLQRVSHVFGWVIMGLKQCVHGELEKNKPKIPLRKFFNHQFAFRRNGSFWSLNYPAAWFVNGGLLKMIVYRDFQIYRFNEVGTKLWRSLYKTGNLAETIEEIAHAYDVPKETVEQDADEFICYLTDEQILRKK